MKILIFSTQSWSDYWVSKHWLSYQLSSTGYSVVFVEPFINRASKDMFINDKLLVRSKGPVLPFFYRYNLILKVVLFRIMYREEILSSDIVVSFDPSAAIASSLFFERKHVVYYSVDPPLGFGRGYEEVLANKMSTKAFTVNALRSIASQAKNIKWEYLPHAFVNVEKMYRLTESQKLALSNRAVCHIVYIGSLNSSYIDTKVVELISANPKLCLHVFGPEANSALSEIDRDTIDALKEKVFMWGGVKYSEMSSLLSHFDAGILLYDKVNLKKPFSKSPLKLANYIANNLPVITTDIPGIYNYMSEELYILRNNYDKDLDRFVRDWESGVLKTVSEYPKPSEILEKILNV